MLLSNDTSKQMKERLSTYYALVPRVVARHEGQIIPLTIRDSMLHVLTELCWPVKRHRPSINADHYAVIARNRPRAGLAHVYEKCEELMEWIDKDFLWTHIAVTKNFVVRKFCSLLILLDILFLLLIEL